jgi:perosamine synthetase
LMTRPLWLPLHQLKPYQDCSKMDLSRAENFAKRVINIPSSSNLMGAL